ncbi:MAG: transglycosylase domain-containing protein [Chloroflexi bacterium]|nr:transglycosylase domain-containing protein [Chloroflexota bacterium]
MLNRGLNLQPDRSRRPLALALASVAAIGLGLAGAFAVFVAGALVGALLLSAPFVNSIFEDLPDVGAVADFSDELFESTVIYSADGVELGELIDEGRRTLLAPDQIPQLIKDAVVASEDASFYDNPGFDLRAVVRAAWLNLRAQDIVSGFSTITQQVVKNSLLSPEQTLERKLREVVLAYRLSQDLAKDEILALYLNQNNYGNLAYGIAAAADTYFGKSVNELSLAEAAMLVGIPRAPTALNPFADLASATRVQHNVLDLMERNRFVTADDVRDAKAETLVFASPDPDFGPAPHFFRYVAEYLQERYGPDVATQGWRVRTTLRLDVQREVEAAVREHVATLLAGGHDAHNAAVVVLDPRNGDILMMIGSVDFGNEDIDGQVNMALAPRQPGSAFKPFTYATLLEQGQTPATLFYDVPVSIPQFGDDEPYEPGNYDLRFRGPVLMRFALANSLNIPAVKAQQLAGVEATLDTARALGLTVAGGPADYGPALALGSAAVPLLDLASAYGAFGQGGLYRPPNPILEITDSRGIEVSGPQRQAPQPAVDERVAFLITDILSDAVSRQAVFGPNANMLVTGHQAAVKTGTTNDFRDAATAGYSTQLAAAVWVGNADNTPMTDVPGSRGALPIWHAAMEIAHSRLAPEPVPFERPPGLIDVEIDPLSGLLPGPFSPTPISEVFIAGTEPFGSDDLHVPLLIHGPSGKLAGPDAPAAEIEETIAVALPPEAWSWQQEQASDDPLAPAPREYADELDFLRPPAGLILASPPAGAVLSSETAVRGRGAGATLSYGLGRRPSEWLPLPGPGPEESDPNVLGRLPVADLPDGPLMLRARIEFPDGSSDEIVRALVIDRQMPQVQLAVSEPGPLISAGPNRLTALASDNGAVARVDFYVDGLRIASDALAPYSVSWRAFAGPHTLSARAIDTAGNASDSAILSVVAA